MTQTANLCIQCKTPDQTQTGTFLFFGEQGQPYRDCTLASPVFSESAALYQWLATEGWTELPRDPAWPAGRFTRTAEWTGSPCPLDPDNFWIDDATGERVPA